MQNVYLNIWIDFFIHKRLVYDYGPKLNIRTSVLSAFWKCSINLLFLVGKEDIDWFTETVDNDSIQMKISTKYTFFLLLKMLFFEVKQFDCHHNLTDCLNLGFLTWHEPQITQL